MSAYNVTYTSSVVYYEIPEVELKFFLLIEMKDILDSIVHWVDTNRFLDWPDSVDELFTNVNRPYELHYMLVRTVQRDKVESTFGHANPLSPSCLLQEDASTLAIFQFRFYLNIRWSIEGCRLDDCLFVEIKFFKNFSRCFS